MLSKSGKTAKRLTAFLMNLCFAYSWYSMRSFSGLDCQSEQRPSSYDDDGGGGCHDDDDTAGGRGPNDIKILFSF